MALSTVYAGSRRRVEALLHLERTVDRRPSASFTVNGHRVERQIEPPYRVFFVAPETNRRVEIEDPTRLTIADFLEAVETRRRPDVARLVDLSDQLDELVAAAAGVAQESA
jgi:hypothetical protein